MEIPYTTEIKLAHYLDSLDELAIYRDRFVITDPDLIYLDGNSLGRLPKATLELMHHAVEHAWGERLIRLWNDGWINTPTELGTKIASLIGAQPGEVLVSESTSTNLFKLATAALRFHPDRHTIVSDVSNFPSDLYIFQGICDMFNRENHKSNYQLKLIPSRNRITIHPKDVESALDDDVALLSLTHVAFKSAFMYDMRQVTTLAHQAGALTLWDLSHSVGAVPLNLNEWNVDLAVGCTYKYLNGGPGSPAFLYIRKDLQTQLMSPIWGWFAAQTPFDFDLEFAPAKDISRFRIGTPPMLSMKAIEPGLEILLEAGIDRLRAKSVKQTNYLLYLFSEWLQPLDFTLGSPTDSAIRGSHVSLRHPHAYQINQAMIKSSPPAVRVIPDFRVPDNIRLGIAPVYTTFTEIHRAINRIRGIVEDKIYEQYSDQRVGVT